MKTKLPAFGPMLFVGIACLVVTGAILWAAPPIATRAPVFVLKTPDLVITRVTFLHFSGVQPGKPALDIGVTVKNVGNVDAPPCTATFSLTSDTSGTPPYVTYVVQVPGIPAGASTQVWRANVMCEWGGWKAMLIAAVDVPVPGKPNGQIKEIGGELNNVFGFAFDTTGLDMAWAHPNSWINPAVK